MNIVYSTTMVSESFLNETTITFESSKSKEELLAEITKLVGKLTSKGFNVTDFQVEFK